MIKDFRHIDAGLPVPSEGYADQPYVVKAEDGAWVLTVTTGSGYEGEPGQHIISMRSTDCGDTWTDIVDVEPADGPESSYAVLLKVPYGRIYCFYNHNTDNIREANLPDGGASLRVDSMGHYVFKYSDDNGKSWSAKRYDVPLREFEIDRENPYGGSLKFFWNVGRPLVRKDEVLFTLHKIHSMLFSRTEGCILQSTNILTERDPEKISFKTLPDGEIGLRAPEGGGTVAEEHKLVELSDNSLCCVYRTADARPAISYSQDNAHTWTQPDYLTYSPGGKEVKNPRAANFIWSCSNGKYLYWFHNHGGAVALADPEWNSWNGRNPVWLMAAREIQTPNGLRLEFSQPEILIYDENPYVGMSYPDLIEDKGRFWVTETQKAFGRVHEIPTDLLNGLFAQWESCEVADADLLLELTESLPGEIEMPKLPDFNVRNYKKKDMTEDDLRAGFTVEIVCKLDNLCAGQVLLDARREDKRGVCIQTSSNGALAISIHDGISMNLWETDPGLIKIDQQHHVVFVVDGGPRIICCVVDGVLCDGGEFREYGWGRFTVPFEKIYCSQTLRLSDKLSLVRIYGRALRTSESISNYRAVLS